MQGVGWAARKRGHGRRRRGNNNNNKNLICVILYLPVNGGRMKRAHAIF